MERNRQQYYQRNQHALHERQQASRSRQVPTYRSDKRSMSHQQYQYSQRTLHERHYQTNPRLQSRVAQSTRPRRPQRLMTVPKPSRAPLKGKWKARTVGLILMLLTLWTVGAVSPLNKVKRLIVTGYHYADPAVIKASTGIRPLDDVRNVVSQKQLIEKAIKASSPIVESITFKHANWKHLEIHVKEHQVVAKVNANNQLRPVLDNGLSDVIVMDESQLANVPLLYNFNQSGAMHDIANSLRKIDTTLLALIERIAPVPDVNKPNSIEVKMKDGNTVYAIISTFDKRIGYYPAIVQQLNNQQGIINLEVGAYFTPYGLDTNSVKLDTN